MAAGRSPPSGRKTQRRLALTTSFSIKTWAESTQKCVEKSLHAVLFSRERDQLRPFSPPRCLCGLAFVYYFRLSSLRNWKSSRRSRTPLWKSIRHGAHNVDFEHRFSIEFEKKCTWINFITIYVHVCTRKSSSIRHIELRLTRAYLWYFSYIVWDAFISNPSSRGSAFYIYVCVHIFLLLINFTIFKSDSISKSTWVYNW